MKRNVLIFHLGALGDFVLTWPLALALARLYPQSRVFYVTHRSKGQLAEKALRIDSTDIEAGWHGLFAEQAALPAPAERLLSSAHTVVSFLSTGEDAWAKNVRRISPDVNLVQFQPPTLANPPVDEHAGNFITRQLAPWPALQTAVQQIQRSIAARGIGNRAPEDGSILIHPGSGAVAKCWPIESFIELTKRLIASGKMVRFIIGHVEQERWSVNKLDQLRAVASLESPMDLVALWRTISTARLFIGNDSGPSHLAAVGSVPTVVIFGVTDPAVWKPLGPKVRVVSGMQNESIDAVLESVNTLLSPDL